MATLDIIDHPAGFAADTVRASEPDPVTGYRRFTLGAFEFQRDEYFVKINWPAKGQTRTHAVPADAFLRAMMRDVAWGFFYGWVNFDHVFGTRNHYGKVDMYAGSFNGIMKEAGVDYVGDVRNADDHGDLQGDPARLDQRGLRPVRRAGRNRHRVRPQERRQRRGDRALRASRRSRMPGLQGDSPLRDDLPVNRAFADVAQDEPEIHVEPGFEGELHAFNLFKYLSRSDVTWNPSVTSVCGHSLFCPTTEEYILPIIHGNDRVEWFMQLSDEIVWEVADKNTGAPRARITMKAGDICGDAGRHPPPGLLDQALDAARVGERHAQSAQALRKRRTEAVSGRLLRRPRLNWTATPAFTEDHSCKPNCSSTATSSTPSKAARSTCSIRTTAR